MVLVKCEVIIIMITVVWRLDVRYVIPSLCPRPIWKSQSPTYKKIFVWRREAINWVYFCHMHANAKTSTQPTNVSCHKKTRELEPLGIQRFLHNTMYTQVIHSLIIVVSKHNISYVHTHSLRPSHLNNMIMLVDWGKSKKDERALHSIPLSSSSHVDHHHHIRLFSIPIWHYFQFQQRSN